eukprot:TRINITY_DN113204_c0_g1_i1.p1 TRINITY_DN113204_c0_g1~~TRINITY_DN113204_c0_g1_i1.p1  ORF type:complete len:289 (+),score=35.21 TRINITY_DN113204_c0_g1_i1:28-894(+)
MLTKAGFVLLFGILSCVVAEHTDVWTKLFEAAGEEGYERSALLFQANLEPMDKVTILVPVDAGWSQVLDSNVFAWQFLKQKYHQNTEMMQLHVIEGKHYADDLVWCDFDTKLMIPVEEKVDGTWVKTERYEAAQVRGMKKGGEVYVSGPDHHLWYKGGNSYNTAKIIAPNFIETDNSIVHLIDAALFPENFIYCDDEDLGCPTGYECLGFATRDLEAVKEAAAARQEHGGLFEKVHKSQSGADNEAVNFCVEEAYGDNLVPESFSYDARPDTFADFRPCYKRCTPTSA